MYFILKGREGNECSSGSNGGHLRKMGGKLMRMKLGERCANSEIQNGVLPILLQG